MAELPFNIPQSLRSFNERFEKNPKTGITKLSRHLKKRGPDAVGHFLLAWFYHLDDQNSLAIREALKAKTYAPGSPLMEHLHYFLVHPEKFEAAIPVENYTSSKKLNQSNRKSPILDLDSLIAMLEAVESKRIRIPGDDEPFDDTNLAQEAEQVDDIISETLAKIHVIQGKKKQAIEMYNQLKEIHPDKMEHYQAEIDKLD
jgi:tetratricopeptide (TPR) repeat protein